MTRPTYTLLATLLDALASEYERREGVTVLIQVSGLPRGAALQRAHSVLNYGLPPMSGQLASRVDVSVLERTIRQAILRFEPRVMEDSLEVKAIDASSVLDTHNVIEFEIRGFMWAQPVPLRLMLQTDLDLETGHVRVVNADQRRRP